MNDSNSNTETEVVGTTVNSVQEPEQIPFGDTGAEYVSQAVVTAKPSLYSRLTQALYGSAKNGIDSNLIDFFERPERLAYGTFGVGDTANTFPDIKPMYDTLGLGLASLKLKGKYLIRADMRFRLQVNANKFQQGRYMLVYVPHGGADVDPPINKWLITHRANLTHSTQLHHVEVDLTTQTEVELIIPYTGMYQGFPQTNNTNAVQFGDLGRVWIIPYSPLVAPTGSTTAPYVLWSNFENVRLESVAIPQMGKVTRSEQASQGVGPITDALQKISKSTSIMGEIPVLSTVMQPASWVAAVTARAANVWGWSKPTNLAAVTTVTPHNLGYQACGDATDSSIPLSLQANNEISQTIVGMNNADEMSFDYLKSIYAYVGSSPWALTDAVDTELFGYALAPRTFSTVYTEGLATYTSDPPVTYFSRPFSYWRGGFKFKFKFVKTMLHSGRLLFQFNPISPRSGGAATANIANSYYTVREIVDISDKTEFEFVIPFVSVVPWLRTNTTTGFGRISVRVLDPLVAPATVSNTIKILLEVAGAPDYQVAVPLNAFGAQNKPCLVYTQQMGFNLENGDMTPHGGLGQSSVDSLTTGPSEYCIGEHFTSFRTLLKRYSSCDYIGVGAGSNFNQWIRPWAINCVSSAGAASYDVGGTTDLYDFIASCFIYSRGGMRIRALDAAGSDVWAAGLSTNNTINQDRTGSAGAGSVGDLMVGMAAAQPAFGTRGIEVFVPQYHLSHTRVNSVEVTNVATGITSASSNDNMSKTMLKIAGAQPSTSVCIFRAGAEDLSLSGFVSTMPLVNAVWP